MDYIDPHHKRTEFTAESYSSARAEGGRRIIFNGRGQHTSVALREGGATIVAMIPESEEEFVLSKVQILEKLKWLTLDFEENSVLRRILVHIDSLNPDLLEADLKSLVGDRALLLFRHQ